MANIVTKSNEQLRQEAIDAVWTVMCKRRNFDNLTVGVYHSERQDDEPRADTVRKRLGENTWSRTLEAVYERRGDGELNAEEPQRESEHGQRADWSSYNR